MVLKVDIERIQANIVGGIATLETVKVDLERHIRPRRKGSIPAGEQVPTEIAVAQGGSRGYRWQQGEWNHGDLSRIALVHFSLRGQGILGGERGIGAESAMNESPVVLAVEASEGGRRKWFPIARRNKPKSSQNRERHYPTPQMKLHEG